MDDGIICKTIFILNSTSIMLKAVPNKNKDNGYFSPINYIPPRRGIRYEPYLSRVEMTGLGRICAFARSFVEGKNEQTRI